MGKKVSAAQAGFSIPEWVAAVGISRAGFYVLQPEIKPAIVRIGKRCLIIEAPDAWLRRVAETQSAHAKAA